MPDEGNSSYSCEFQPDLASTKIRIPPSPGGSCIYNSLYLLSHRTHHQPLLHKVTSTLKQDSLSLGESPCCLKSEPCLR